VGARSTVRRLADHVPARAIIKDVGSAGGGCVADHVSMGLAAKQSQHPCTANTGDHVPAEAAGERCRLRIAGAMTDHMPVGFAVR
jgi:hypothetical protein